MEEKKTTSSGCTSRGCLQPDTSSSTCQRSLFTLTDKNLWVSEGTPESPQPNWRGQPSPYANTRNKASNPNRSKPIQLEDATRSHLLHGSQNFESGVRAYVFDLLLFTFCLWLSTKRKNPGMFRHLRTLKSVAGQELNERTGRIYCAEISATARFEGRRHVYKHRLVTHVVEDNGTLKFDGIGINQLLRARCRRFGYIEPRGCSNNLIELTVINCSSGELEFVSELKSLQIKRIQSKKRTNINILENITNNSVMFWFYYE